MNIEHLPAVIAIPWRHFTHETNPRLKLWAACEVYEVLVRFGVMLQLAELRALPDADDRLAAAVARIRDHIGSPTLGKWLGMMSELAGQLRRTDPLVLPELPTLTNALAALAPKDAPREWDASLLVLRNALAHGGGVTAPIAERLLADWEPLLRGAMQSLACLAGTTVVWFEAGYARPITPDGGLAEALTISADLRTTLTAAGLDRRVLLLKGDRTLNLWPLCDYAPAVMNGWGRQLDPTSPVPQVYLRAETNRLLYAALGCDVPVHTSSGHAAFREFFGLNRKPEPHQPTAHDFAADLLTEQAAVKGRKKELQELKAQVKVAPDRVLWVFGPGGIGKSYLVAKLAYDLSNGKQFATVFWRFRAGDADRCNRHAFFRHAIRTLGDPAFGFVTTQAFPSLDPSQLLKQYLDLLKDAGTSTARRLLFVLDGMDEIARTDPDFVRSILEWRSGSAVWVCAGRHEGDVVPGVFAADKCQHVWPRGLPGMSETEVRQMIDARIGSANFAKLLASDIDRDGGTYNQLSDAITRRAAGLPLYVHFVCEDILAGQLTLDGTLPSRLPNKLEDYFEKLLKAAEADDEDAIPAPLIAVCAWAMRPLDEDTLFELLARRDVLDREDESYSRDRLRGVIARLGTILRPAMLTDDRVGYEPYHLTFRDHIREDRTDRRRIQSRKAREVFCRMTSDWQSLLKGGSVRDYTLRHGSEHLLREKRWAELETLARDEKFLTAQRNELPADPAAVIRTLQHALTAASEQDSGIKMAEAVLRLADRNEQIRQASPLDLLRGGNLEGAMKLADLHEPEMRLLWYLVLSYESRTKSSSQLLSHLIERAFQPTIRIASASTVHIACILLRSLAPYILPRYLELALICLENEDRLCLIRDLISSHGELCDSSLAKCDDTPAEPNRTYWLDLWPVLSRVSTSIQSGRHRCRAFTALAVAQWLAGDQAGACSSFNEAVQALASVNGEYSRSELLAEVAEAQASVGDSAAAQTADGIPTEPSRSRALVAVAIAQVRSGDVANAIEIASRIDDFFRRSEAYTSIAKSQATAGDLLGFADSIKFITSECDLHDALAAFWQVTVEGLVLAGDLGGAILTVERISDESLRNGAYAAMAEAQLRVGDLAGAALTVDKCSGNNIKHRVIAAPGEAQARAGDLVSATLTFARATQAADQLQGEINRNPALARVTESQIRAGELSGAVQTAERITDKSGQCRVLLAVAAAQTEAGDLVGADTTFARAVQIAELPHEKSLRCNALSRVAEAQARAGNSSGAAITFARATKIAESLQGEHLRWNALMAVAQAQARTGESTGAATTFASALRGVGRSEDESPWLDTMATVAEAQASAGDSSGATITFAHAVHATEKLTGESDRIKALTRLAESQVRAGDLAGASTTFTRTLQVAHGIAHISSRINAFKVIATAQARAGDSSGAANTFTQAIQTAETIAERFAQIRTLMDIGDAQGETGDLVGAAQTFNSCPDHSGRDLAFAAMAEAQVRQGVFAGVAQMAAKIESNFGRSKAFSTLAEAQAASGELSAATTTFAHAIQFAESAVDEYSRRDALVMVVEAQSRANDLDSASQTAERVSGESGSSRAWAAMAIAHARAGNWAAATICCNRILDRSLRCEAWSATGEAQVRGGDPVGATVTFNYAIQTAAAITDAYSRASALTTVAQAQVRVGEMTAASLTFTSAIQSAIQAADYFQSQGGSKSNTAVSMVASAVAGSKNRRAYKICLQFTARNVECAIHACGQLARLYPADATAIAELLIARQPAATGESA